MRFSRSVPALTLFAVAVVASLACEPDAPTPSAHEPEVTEVTAAALTANECALAGGQCDASNTCVRQELRCNDGPCTFVPVVLGECGSAPPPPPGGGGGGGGSNPQCRCTVRVRSKDRFVRGKLDLECGGHGGHGFCSNNVDTAIHSAGCGAMTGNIKVNFGSAGSQLNCADDHQTCFRGPASCDGGGTWSNLCSCDSNGDLPAGVTTADQFDPTEISQYNVVLTTPGTCGTVDLVVNERIVEHDPFPFGLDDPMGHLITTPIRPGVGTQTHIRPVSQTINRVGPRGPYSGSFGATLKIETICTQL